MNTENNSMELKSLPKVEVSFQDHFCGCEDEYTSTPKYILDALKKQNIIPKIGDSILLWEKDTNIKDEECYLCNVAKMETLNAENLLEFKINSNDKVMGGQSHIFFKIDKNAYFDLPINSVVFPD